MQPKMTLNYWKWQVTAMKRSDGALALLPGVKVKSVSYAIEGEGPARWTAICSDGAHRHFDAIVMAANKLKM